MKNIPEFTDLNIGGHYIFIKDVSDKLKKNFSCILIGIPSEQFKTARIFCNNECYDVDPEALQEAHQVKRFIIFVMLDKGGWNDYKGSFDLIEEAQKSLGLYKLGGHKYQIVDLYTGNPIYE